MAEADDEIASLEAKVDQISSEIPQAREKVVDATVEFSREWFDNAARQTVVGDPERAKELGTDGLRALKEEIASLKEGLPDALRAHFEQCRAFPKMEDASGETPYDTDWVRAWLGAGGSSGLPKGFEKALRRALGSLDSLLRPRGFDLDQSRRWASGADQYGGELEIKGPLNDALLEFQTAWKALVTESGKAQKARDARDRAEATDLWDDA